jgi:hypothetical protein
MNTRQTVFLRYPHAPCALAGVAFRFRAISLDTYTRLIFVQVRVQARVGLMTAQKMVAANDFHEPFFLLL